MRPGKRTPTKVLLRVVIVRIVLPIQDRRMKDPQHAFLVVLVKQQTREVPNATEPPAKLAPLKTVILENVQSVHKVGNLKNWMPWNASVVMKGKKQPLQVVVLVRNVIWADSI